MELARIGQNADHGLDRMAFSPEDMKAREWLKTKMKDAGLKVRQDGAANIIGRLEGKDPSLPSLILGSHIDTVPNAGHLDGTLGVLSGLECLRVLNESKTTPDLPIELVSFSDEEGRFGGLLGSQAFCGQISPEDLHTAVDLDGIKLTDTLQAVGLDPMEVLHAGRSPDSVMAYLELHIEQGPVLDRERIPVGIVDEITGLFKCSARLRGIPNHAGTTPMKMRNDAFLGLSEFALSVQRVLEEYGTERSRATIGKATILPGAPNTVPGDVEFSLDVRDTNKEILYQLEDAFSRSLHAIARKRGLEVEWNIQSRVSPSHCHQVIVKTLQDAAQRCGAGHLLMPSGAAHDAQIMASIAPIGMIFVPSKEGRSHSPAEWSSWEDIEYGANVFLEGITQLITMPAAELLTLARSNPKAS